MKPRKPSEPTTPAPSGEAGFTLIEALIAMVILIFGLMAVANLMMIAASSNSVANQSTAATALASKQLDDLRSVPFNTLRTQTGGDLTQDSAGFFRQDQVEGVGTIDTRWKITSLNGQSLFIEVRSEGMGVMSRGRSRSEFTTIRSCTDTALGCPAP
jgi:type II secretory pathway pseudopilin PulG